MRYLSLFSGIEAASVAWHPLGWTPLAFAEIEKFPSQVLAHHYPDVPNLGDITASDFVSRASAHLPDVFVGGSPCFTAGHLVLTATGYRPIESLRVGDQVITHNGRLRRIARVGSKEAAVGRLSAVGRPEGWITTPDHPFLSVPFKANYRRRHEGCFDRHERIGQPEWIEAKEMPGRQWCALTNYDVPLPPVESRFNDETAMYLAGMYLGDGYIRRYSGKSKKSLTLCLNEKKIGQLEKAVGQAVPISYSRERTATKAVINDTRFCNWLSRHFGEHSHSKTLPAWVLGHPHRDSLLRGYLDTDGSRNGDAVSISTTSISLAHGIADLLSSTGQISSVALVEVPRKTEIEGRTVNQRDFYQVRAWPQSKSRKSRKKASYILRTVQKFELSDNPAVVYNIEVEDDHSYVVNGAVVHNCQAFSVAGLRKSLSDARGNLALRYVQIMEAVDAARSSAGLPPIVVVWENVPGVLSTSDNAFGCFLGALAGEDDPLQPPGERWEDAGCVYGPRRAIAWRVLDAQYFGLAQRRRRVFLVASARTGFDPASVLFEFDGLRRDSPPGRETRKGPSAAPAQSAGTVAPQKGLTEFLPQSSRIYEEGGVGPTLQGTGAHGGQRTPAVLAFGGGNTGGPIDPAACLVAKAQRLDFEVETFAVHCEDTAVTQCASGNDSPDDRDSLVVVGMTGEVSHALKAEGADASEDGTGRGQPIVAYAIQEGAERENPGTGPDGVGVQEQRAYTLEARARPQSVAAFRTSGNCGAWNTGDRTDALTTGSDPNTHLIAFSSKDYGGDAQGDIAPTLRAMPHHGSHANAGGQLAVAFAQNQREEVRTVEVAGSLATIRRGDGKNETLLADLQTVAQPLRSNPYNNSDPGMEARMHVADGTAIRRLTPTECEKLMGFPVGYTRIPIRVYARRRLTSTRPEDRWEPLPDGRWMLMAADGPRYKALGNSMAVPCMAWLGMRIEHELAKLEGRIACAAVTRIEFRHVVVPESVS
ncbi:MAG: DNA cytosine methyltransferase [Sinobacteraceae bacterium]|nr:DNA cytosine methyltransferase [Nevskiaceae bacterium]